jgi:hypothetical protein
VKARRSGLSLAIVRDLRVARRPVTVDELAAFETDVLAGFVLARAAAGLSDGTIASDVVHLEQVRAWFGRRCTWSTRRSTRPSTCRTGENPAAR